MAPVKDVEIVQHSTGNINNIPHPHNPNFTGRVDLLEKLHEALASGERAAFTQTQAITGLGGVGKTQLALEYSYRHADDYRVIWWARSEEPGTLAADYAGLASRLDLPEKNAKDQRITVEAVRCWLEQNGGWLLVFDNAQNFKDLKDYLPRARSGHVIITSRNQSWGSVARMLPVDIFTPAESVVFLRRRTGLDDEGAAKALAEALGNLPLALEQAGAYIEETGISLSAYLQLFQERHKDLLSRGKPDTYPDTVATTWELSFQKASEEVPASADLLNLCAFLAPDDIPKSLLTDGVEHLPEPLASAVVDEMALNDAVAALKRYSLLTVADDSLSIHRLVQAVARDQLSDEERKRWVEAAVRLVSYAFPYESVEVRTWFVCSVILPHSLAAAKHAEEIEAAQRETQHLLNQTGLYLNSRAEFKEARGLYERALHIAETFFGQEHNEVATIINNLGRVLQDMGNLEGAKKNFERALQIGEKVYGTDHPQVAIYINNLGMVLKDLGDLGDAKKSVCRALQIGEKVYGTDHPQVAIYVNNLGLVLQDMGDLEGAKKNFERALQIDEKVCGLTHPNVARDTNNLGLVLRDLGDLTGAKKNYERALKINEMVYTTDHPNVATIVNNLGSVLRALGDLEGAKKNFERALQIDEKVYGLDHPKVARDINNLGLVLRDLGDLAGAKKNFERALQIDEKFYGTNHPEVARDINNLGLVVQDMGDLEGAKKSFERALEIDEKFYGTNHPEVARDVNNLGAVLRALGDLAGAKEHYERALEILQSRLGEDHPKTKIVRENLELLKR